MTSKYSSMRKTSAAISCSLELTIIYLEIMNDCLLNHVERSAYHLETNVGLLRLEGNSLIKHQKWVVLCSNLCILRS